jgi:hypothetical protein
MPTAERVVLEEAMKWAKWGKVPTHRQAVETLWSSQVSVWDAYQLPERVNSLLDADIYGYRGKVITWTGRWTKTKRHSDVKQ